MLIRFLFTTALVSGIASSSLSAQAAPWTEQQIRDMCAHKPGAPMRLYGCRISTPEPLYIVDGVRLSLDSAGPVRARRDSIIAAALASPRATLTVLKPGDAIALYGVAGNHGAVRIMTDPESERAKKPSP
jgi:hypothetical protein